MFDSLSPNSIIDISEIIRVAKNGAMFGVICKKDMMPYVSRKPKHYERLHKAYRVLTNQNSNAYMKVIGAMRRFGISNMHVEIVLNDNVSFDNDSLIQYYLPNRNNLEDDMFCKTGLINSDELLEYVEDLCEIIRSDNEYVAFTQSYILGEIQKKLEVLT